MKKIIFSTLLVIYSNILLSQNNLINSDIYLDERHSVISQRITKLIEDLHYSRPRLDNAFSSEILDKYLDTLDTNRLYFQSNDINSFSKYRYEIDNLSKDGNLDFIFEIFTLLKTRTEDRINFAIQLLEEEPDFSVDESFIFDRRDMTWPKNDDFQGCLTWSRK